MRHLDSIKNAIEVKVEPKDGYSEYDEKIGFEWELTEYNS